MPVTWEPFCTPRSNSTKWITLWMKLLISMKCGTLATSNSNKSTMILTGSSDSGLLAHLWISSKGQCFCTHGKIQPFGTLSKISKLRNSKWLRFWEIFLPTQCFTLREARNWESLLTTGLKSKTFLRNYPKNTRNHAIQHWLLRSQGLLPNVSFY